MFLAGHSATERVAVTVVPFVADIVTLVDRDVNFVETVKVALVLPAGIVTLAGTVATVVALLARATTIPPEGAEPVSVTVPVEDMPPSTELGFSLSEVSATGVTVKVAVWVAR
jgi:hypothetical protein